MANPKFTMLSDTSRILEIEGWETRSMDMTGGGAFVQFEGDNAPRGFRNAVLAATFDCTAVWPRWNIATANTFHQMLRDAYNAVDGRFLLEHGDKFAANILASTIVEIHEWNLTIRKPSGIIAISFTATEVV